MSIPSQLKSKWVLARAGGEREGGVGTTGAAAGSAGPRGGSHTGGSDGEGNLPPCF